MYRMNLKETQTNVATLHEIENPEVFQIILDFIYKGKIEVREENCQFLLAAANMLQLPEVSFDVRETAKIFSFFPPLPSFCSSNFLFSPHFSCRVFPYFRSSTIAANSSVSICIRPTASAYSALPSCIRARISNLTRNASSNPNSPK